MTKDEEEILRTALQAYPAARAIVQRLIDLKINPVREQMAKVHQERAAKLEKLEKMMGRIASIVDEVRGTR